MSLPKIAPEEAKRLMDDGATLIDIRGADEHARERIIYAQNKPVGTLTRLDDQSRPVIFHCKSGNRTAINASKLAELTACEAYILEGGIEAWKKAGLPVACRFLGPSQVSTSGTAKCKKTRNGCVLSKASKGVLIGFVRRSWRFIARIGPRSR